MNRASASVTFFEGADQQTGCLEGHVAYQGGRLAIECGGRRFGVSPGSVERASVEALPAQFPKQFDDGVTIQWAASGQRRQAVLEAERTVLVDLLRRLCAGCLDGVGVRVEQQVTPRQVEGSAEPGTVAIETSLTVDPVTGVVGFDTGELHDPLPTPASLSVKQFPRHYQTAGQVGMLTPEADIVTRVVPGQSRIALLLRDHLVAAYTLTNAGGPISVLFVDDEPALTELAQLQLKKHHDELSIQATTSTDYAKQLLTDESFECVVSDYEMPDGGAADLLSIAQADEQPLPCIILSRWDEESIPSEQRPPGIDAWVQKKVGADQYHRLGELVKRLVVQRRCAE